MSRIFLEVFKDPILRKLIYVEKVASDLGIVCTGWRFEQLLDLIRQLIGYNVLLRFYMNLFGQLNLGFSFELTEFFRIQMSQQFVPPLPGREKARYGISKYGLAYYDPTQVTGKELEYWCWDMSYHTTSHVVPEYRQRGLTVKSYIEVEKDLLKRLGIADYYVDALESCIAWAEGKVKECAYWGFACWDVSPWQEAKTTSPERYWYHVRSTKDWLTLIDLETITIIESNWEYSMWDYSIWTPEKVQVKPELEEHLAKTIEDFHRRVEPLWQAVFLLQRMDKLHHVGGYHQIRMQQLIIRVKDILCRLGVPVIQHHAYISALLELAYMYHDSSRHYKTWKKVLSPQDWLAKWTRMGLREDILRELASLLGVKP